MRGYTQLSREQEYQIQALLKTQQTYTQIARVLGVHKTTISRELQRTRGQRGYPPHQAYCRAHARQETKNRPRLTPVIWQQVETLLRQTWSPEQIHGRLQREQGQTISHEWVYQHIYEDKRTGGDLYRFLRCQKQRRKRYGTYSRRGRITNQISIEDRPAMECDSTAHWRLGEGYDDWERASGGSW